MSDFLTRLRAFLFDELQGRISFEVHQGVLIELVEQLLAFDFADMGPLSLYEQYKYIGSEFIDKIGHVAGEAEGRDVASTVFAGDDELDMSKTKDSIWGLLGGHSEYNDIFTFIDQSMPALK